MYYCTMILLFLGCNLSPLLFALYISALGAKLNTSGLGIELMGIIICAIFFADDIVLIGRNKEELSALLAITEEFCIKVRLELSEEKSKVMTHDAATGRMIFSNNNAFTSLELEQVLMFKYLGLPISAAPYSLFKSFNENVKKKAKAYLTSVLSLVKAGPDRSELAHTLWTRCAIPSILYGCEIMPVSQITLREVEKCQGTVGKFILQLPQSSANVGCVIDAGLRPIWSVIAEKVIIFANRLMRRDEDYWPKKAFRYHLSIQDKSPYYKYLRSWKSDTSAFGVDEFRLRAAVRKSAIIKTLNEQRRTSVTTFAMNPPTLHARWFQPKSWVSDSPYSKVIAEFRSCNLGLGNRGPTKDGRFIKICLLCQPPALNNEVGSFPQIN